MRNFLAGRLLGNVLGWESGELAVEHPIIDALARLKYDEYQQFKPGMKFLESLAQWLVQFEPKERRDAYSFIRQRLVFLSNSEMNHLVDITYATVIRPILLRRVAVENDIPYWQSNKIAHSQQFKELKRRCLFLGLSDGARMDRFRRTNNDELSNEQIQPYYELPNEKVRGLINDLRKDLAIIRNGSHTLLKDEDVTFQTIFLLDDFSASGVSMLRADGEVFKGKLNKIRTALFDIGAPLANAIDPNGCDVYSIIYVMTEKATKHFNELIPKFWNRTKSNCVVYPVLTLGDEINFGRPEDIDMASLVDKYYDGSTFDENLAVGETKDVKMGFAGCRLPVVLSHNTPNNSLFLLWSNEFSVRGLFPRITRHKEA
jgi:hypothetical protein